MDLGSDSDSVILSQFLDVSEFQFPHLQNEHTNNNTSLEL